MYSYGLFSTSNKAKVHTLARKWLSKQRKRIVATGQTYNLLQDDLADKKHLINPVHRITGYPELLDGKVKTLHPQIFAGILGHVGNHRHVGGSRHDDLQRHKIADIPLVVANLYECHNESTIDIGGSAILRAAIKNWQNVTVVTDPNDYDLVAGQMDRDSDSDSDSGHDLLSLRKYLAQKACQHVLNHDLQMNKLFSTELKYGMNPHQQAWASLSNFDLHGSNPSLINLYDAVHSFRLVTEVARYSGKVCAASFKHNSPAGVAIADTPQEAITKARNCDPLSSFGDFIAVSHHVNSEVAITLKSVVSDGIIAPNFKENVAEELRKKKHGKFIVLSPKNGQLPEINFELRSFGPITLLQEANNIEISAVDLQYQLENSVSGAHVFPYQLADIKLGNHTLKYTQSNSVVVVYQGQVIGVGAGQQNRLACVKLALDKAKLFFAMQTKEAKMYKEKLNTTSWKRADKINAMVEYCKLIKVELPRLTLCSDGFFPFADSIELAAEYNVNIICQPGGSINDEQVLRAAQNRWIAMIMTGKRLFTH